LERFVLLNLRTGKSSTAGSACLTQPPDAVFFHIFQPALQHWHVSLLNLHEHDTRAHIGLGIGDFPASFEVRVTRGNLHQYFCIDGERIHHIQIAAESAQLAYARNDAHVRDHLNQFRAGNKAVPRRASSFFSGHVPLDADFFQSISDFHLADRILVHHVPQLPLSRCPPAGAAVYRHVRLAFMGDRTRARELAAEFHQKGDPTGWFEQLYQEGEAGKSVVPWADLQPNRHLLDFWRAHPLPAAGKSALVVGSGLGDDAEQLAGWGFEVTAFDISPTAIRAGQQRFPDGPRSSGGSIEHVAADVFHPPAKWKHNFDFILEIYTLQALPATIRLDAMNKIASFLRPGGHLLLIAMGRNADDPVGQLPWPLTREELSAFSALGLREISFESFPEPDDPAILRFRALYQSDPPGGN
jgi:SAM-dependent methyltransferase